MCLIYFICRTLESCNSAGWNDVWDSRSKPWKWNLKRVPLYLSWKNLSWHWWLWKQDKILLFESIKSLVMSALVPQYWRQTFGKRCCLFWILMRTYSSRLFDRLFDSGWLSSSLHPLMYCFQPQNLGSAIGSSYWHEVIFLTQPLLSLSQVIP